MLVDISDATRRVWSPQGHIFAPSHDCRDVSAALDGTIVPSALNGTKYAKPSQIFVAFPLILIGPPSPATRDSTRHTDI